MVLSKDRTVLIHLQESDWQQLAWKISHDRRSSFTLNLRDPDFTKPVRRVAVLVVDGHVMALGLGRSLGRSGDLDTLVKFTDIHILAPASISVIAEQMNLHSHGAIVTLLEAGGVFSPNTSRKFFDVLSVLSPGSMQAWETLRELQQTSSRVMSAHHRLLEEQRDAVALSLEVVGIDSRRALQGWEFPSDNAPFLAGLSRGGTSEASIIRHDATHFETWLRVEGHIYDVLQFVDPDDARRRMTVTYADKEPLERVTGTDLIYYRHQNPGYVLVQYKRMKRRTGEGKPLEWLYRPDLQLVEEIRRMREIVVTGTNKGVDQWRLSNEPFYVKLCEDDMTRAEGGKLTKGMYFPLGLFEEILESPSIVGPRGGKAIGWHNAQRWLSNTAFIELLREGWIGSIGEVTQQITSLVQNALEGNRGVILARDDSQSPGMKQIRYRRTGV